MLVLKVIFVAILCVPIFCLTGYLVIKLIKGTNQK